MLVAMAVLGLTTYALLLSQPHLLTSLAQSDPGPAFQESPHTCTHADKESVWSQLPHCEPRNTLVEVPLPTDHPNVLNVSKATIQMDYINPYYLTSVPGCAEARGACPVCRHVPHLWWSVQAVHGGQRGGDQRAGDVRDCRDLGPGRHQGGGGLLRPKHGGPHCLLLWLPGARMLTTTGQATKPSSLRGFF